MLDTKGPEIRTGMLVGNKPVEFENNQDLIITTDYSFEGTNEKIACSYKSLPETVSVGSIIFIADGSLTCEVTEILEVSRRVKNNYKFYFFDDYLLKSSNSHSVTLFRMELKLSAKTPAASENARI